MLKVKMMKKLMSSLLIVISGIVLTGCTLAEEEPNYYNQTDNTKAKDPSDYYIPSGIEFSLRDNAQNEIDVSDYFYINFACPDLTVFDNCFSADIGPSMSSEGISIHVYEETINDIEQPTIEEITIDVTLYKLKDSFDTQNDKYWISYSMVYMNIEGKTKTEGRHSTNFASGISLYGNVESEMADGTINRVNYTIHYEGIDKLQSTTIKQFDKDDNMVEQLTFVQSGDYAEIELNEAAEYFIIIEEYLDEEGNLYQARGLYEKSETVYHQLMFTNEYGFLTGDFVIINPITYPVYSEEIVTE